MSFLDQLRDSVDARISEVSQEITALEAALVALRDDSTPAADPAPRRRGRPKGSRNRPAATPALAAVPSPAPVLVVPRRAKPKPAKLAKPAKATEPAAAVTPVTAAAPRAAKPATNGASAAAPERKAKAAGRGRATELLVADRLVAMLGESTEGLSAISISKQAGAGYNQVLALLRQLEESGDVRRTGTRRTSLWRRVTDEERIAERAQELAGLAPAS